MNNALIAVIVWLAVSSMALAADPVPGLPAIPAPGKVGERSKSVNFDDAVIEGMNRNPLDALEHIEKRDRLKKLHLYKKRRDFKKELKEASRSTEYQR